MRFYILDDLISPQSGEPLHVRDAHISEREGPVVERCIRWCGVHGIVPESVPETDCAKCGRLWIEKGTLSDGRNQYPIIRGIPRFVNEGDAGIDSETQNSFGYEWEHFDRVLPDYEREVENYFGIVPQPVLKDAVVIDAGCGMGRWAQQVTEQPIRRLYAVDFSRAIDSAANTLAEQPKAHCVQADVCNLPFRRNTADFSYCLGVLHHLEDPDAGMRNVAHVTQGPMLVYLYYALDNRPRFHRMLLAAVTAARQVTSRLPKRMMFGLSWLIGVLVYWPLARLARLLACIGFTRVAEQIPLSHYREYSLKFMVGDAFDRFATPIEKRYSRAEISAWFQRYGRKATFSDRSPFWVSLGVPER